MIKVKVLVAKGASKLQQNGVYLRLQEVQSDHGDYPRPRGRLGEQPPGKLLQTKTYTCHPRKGRNQPQKKNDNQHLRLVHRCLQNQPSLQRYKRLRA